MDKTSISGSDLEISDCKISLALLNLTWAMQNVRSGTSPLKRCHVRANANSSARYTSPRLKLSAARMATTSLSKLTRASTRGCGMHFSTASEVSLMGYGGGVTTREVSPLGVSSTTSPGPTTA